MIAQQSQVIREAGFFVLRTPLMPFGCPFGGTLDGAVVNPSLPTEALFQALSVQIAETRARMRSMLSRPEVREALLLASQDLVSGIDKWMLDPDSRDGRKVELAIAKYLARLSTRCTPFGLFAGCSVGHVRDQTMLEIGPLVDARRHTRLDGAYLSALVAALVNDRTLRRELRFVPNSSLYQIGERLHCVETRLDGRLRSHHLVAIASSDGISAILELAQGGATISDLASVVVDDDVSLDEAESFVHDLIDSQILVPTLDTPVTGDEPIHGIIDTLAATTAGGHHALVLTQVRDALAELDRQPIGTDLTPYKTIEKYLQPLPAAVDAARLFQVDMIPPAEATISQGLMKELTDAVQFLSNWGGAATDPLAQFRSDYRERYEARAVPLVHALDEDVGIGFRYSAQTPQGARERARSILLAEELISMAGRGSSELEVSDSLLDRLGRDNEVELPDSFSVFCSLRRLDSRVRNDDEHQIVINGPISGPSGANLFGRFCHADPELMSKVKGLLRAEADLSPDKVFAEIAHLPAGRLGNVLCRPVLRDYEIPYLGNSGAPPDQRIPVTDLLVSVDGDRVILTSRTLGREVLPRLTTAHNFAAGGNLPLYQFLCAMQYQGVKPLSWDWGLLSSLPFLPRVRRRGVVLARARWQLNASQLRSLDHGTREARFVAVQALRDTLRLPRLVLLADGDNQLLVDFDLSISIDAFVDLVRRRTSATLVELLPCPDELVATSKQGSYAHELVIPFLVKRERASSASRQIATIKAESRERIFPPATEWLYAKIYVGRGNADLILRDCIAPTVDRATRAAWIDRWFFIRYADPAQHLRVRFRGPRAELVKSVLPLLEEHLEPFVMSGVVWRVQLDTYQRELERYGGLRGIELAERIFHADSDAVLALLKEFPGDAGEQPRRLFALRGVHLLLREFVGSLQQCRELLTTSIPPADAALRRSWSIAFRRDRAMVEQMVGAQAMAPENLHAGFEILRRRSDVVRSALEQMLLLNRLDELPVPIESLVLSLTHMWVNRSLRENQRSEERVMYDFLVRLYDSLIARSGPSHTKSLSSAALR